MVRGINKLIMFDDSDEYGLMLFCNPQTVLWILLFSLAHVTAFAFEYFGVYHFLTHLYFPSKLLYSINSRSTQLDIPHATKILPKNKMNQLLFPLTLDNEKSKAENGECSSITRPRKYHLYQAIAASNRLVLVANCVVTIIYAVSYIHHNDSSIHVGYKRGNKNNFLNLYTLLNNAALVQNSPKILSLLNINVAYLIVHLMTVFIFNPG